MNDAPPADAVLDFDRADMPSAASMSCAICKTAIESTYYGVNGKNLCPSCRDKLQAGREQGSFWLALVYGLGAALAGAVVCYAIGAMGGGQWGLISIFVGLFIGRGVRKGGQLRSGKRFRALAIVLTYTAITAGYLPSVMKSNPTEPWLVAAIWSFILPGIMIAHLERPLSIIILGIGVYEAWKHSAAPVLQVQGPFQLAAPQPPAAEPAAEPEAAPNPAPTTH